METGIIFFLMRLESLAFEVDHSYLLFRHITCRHVWEEKAKLLSTITGGELVRSKSYRISLGV